MNQMNRRAFARRAVVNTAMATSIAVALPRLFAAPLQVRRVAVIGHTGRGDYGHGLDVMWQRIADAEVVAVADGAGLAAAQKRMPGVAAFVDYRQMLNQIKPEIVAIAPRHVDQHHDMCIAAVDSGARGIYIEKPLCRTPLEADSIVAACKQSRVSLAVAHRNRYHPVLPVVKGLIASGEIGELLEIRARGKEDHRGGAQDLWVLGGHLFDVASHLVGPPIACTGMLYQDGRPCTQQDIRPGDEGIGPIAGNEAHARFEMADGTPLFFDSIQNHGERAAGFGLQLVGTKGIFDLRIDREPLAHIRRGNPHDPNLPSEPWLAVSSAGIDQREPIDELALRIAGHQEPGEDLIASIDEGRSPRCDAEAGRTTIEMISAVFESHRLGGIRVEIPLSRREHPFG